MKIYRNDTLITRNGRIGFISALLGPVLLAVGASIVITGGGLGVSLLLLIAGFIVYQIGQAFQRFGRGADKDFDAALKKLPDTYSLHHFTSPVAHLLLGPAGIWILVPRYGKGAVTYDAGRNRWKLKPHNFIARVMGGGLARPELEIISEADGLDRFLQKQWQHDEHPLVNAALVMMDNDVGIEADEAVVPTLHLTKVYGFMKNEEKKKSIALENVSRIKELILPEGNPPLA
jgi:hypothetical protein